MIWSKPRFQHSFELLPRVLKEVAPLLLPLSLALWGLEYYVAWVNKARFDNPMASSMLTIVALGLIGILLQSIVSVIWLLYVARSTQRQMKNGHGEHPLVFLKEHFHQTFIESVRAFISIGIYTLFFILPGIVRWVKLVFTCFVSAFDPDYLKGKKDALKESSRLVKGAWLPLLILLLVQAFIPYLFEEFALGNYGLGADDQGDGGLSLNLLSLPFYLVAFVLEIYFAIYFSLTFFARWSFKTERPT